MELMDVGSDDEGHCGAHGRRLEPARRTGLSYRDKKLDVSDMDVDHMSPGHDATAKRSSVSFENITKSMCSVLTFNNTSDSSDYEQLLTEETSVPCKTDKLSTQKSFFKNTLQPANTISLRAIGFGKAKTKYGIPDEETNFTHIPDPAVGSSTQKRQSRSSSASVTNSKQNSTNSLKNNHKKNINSQTETNCLETKSIKKSTCMFFTLKSIVVTVIISSLCLIVAYFSVNEKEKCQRSREFKKRVLELELETNVFGQHIASKIVPDAIEEYFFRFSRHSLSQNTDASAITHENTDVMCKPLVLSFDGWTGVGKNYVSRFISQAFQHSKVMNYVIPLMFPHNSLEDTYGEQIENWILGNITQCRVNIIVLDEMDKAYPKVVEGLVKVINKLTLPCASSSPIILLLLSNAHANGINRAVLTFLQESPSNKREQLTSEHFNSILSTPTSNSWYSTGPSIQHLIYASVPFLPLEREHVAQCIKRELVSKRLSTDPAVVNKIIQELSFSIYGSIHFSQTGCKRVADKVDLVMYENQHPF